MLAKWLVAAFLGFSALFATDLRAQVLTSTMSERVANIRKDLGLEVEIMSYLLDDKPGAARVERVLKTLDSELFREHFPLIVEKCRVKPEKIVVGTMHFLASDGLGIDVYQGNLKKFIGTRQSDCERAFQAMSEAAEAVAPLDVSAKADEIFSMTVRASDVERWSAALESGQLSAPLKEHQEQCGQEVQAIRITRLSRYDRTEKQFGVDAADSVDAFVGQLRRAASGCRRTMQRLRELNEKEAVSRGVLFYFNPEIYFEGKASAGRVRAWVDFFAGDPRRIEDLRDRILASARAGDYTKTRECLASLPVACKPMPVVPVEFGTFTGFISYGGFATVFLAFGQLVTAISAVDAEVSDSKTVYLDLGSRPHIPKAFH